MRKPLTLVLGIVVLAAFASLGIANTASAQQKPCAGLSGQALTACLQAKVERDQREADRITKNNRRLDKAIQATCTARTVGGVAAGTAGKVVGGPAGRAAASGVWHGATAVGDKAAGNEHPCTPRAQ